ncbi:TolC family protein [Sphingobacteriales bacterium UPWRP_1]|nr:hypothetical protein BVG80_01680 [Sphingobacteriales bacterium TSM_CSM]PSJ72997.1 TolC family protein [Sphingobacteriales bacterium UPWRP_1]
MKRLFALLLPLLVACNAAGLLAQQNLSLKEAIKLAVERSLQVKIAGTETKIAHNNNHAGASGILPVVGAQLYIGNNINTINNAAEFANGYYTNSWANMAASLNYVVFDGFQFTINRQRLQLAQQQAETVYETQQQQTALNTALAYYKAVLEKSKLEAARKTYKFTEERYKNALLQQRLGTLSQYDLGQYEIACLADSAAVYLQQNAFITAMNDLALLLQTDPETTPVTLTDTLEYRPVAWLKNAVTQQILTNNTQYKQLQLNVSLLKNNTRLKKASLLPSLHFNAALIKGVNRIRFDNLPAQNGGEFNLNVGLGLQIPVWEGNIRKRNLQQAVLLQKIGEYRLQIAEQELSNQLNNLMSGYQRQLKIIEIQEKIMASASATIKLAAQRYQSGISNFLEYRNLQTEYNKAQTAKLQAIFELKVTELNMMLLSGNISDLLP